MSLGVCYILSGEGGVTSASHNLCSQGCQVDNFYTVYEDAVCEVGGEGGRGVLHLSVSCLWGALNSENSDRLCSPCQHHLSIPQPPPPFFPQSAGHTGVGGGKGISSHWTATAGQWKYSSWAWAWESVLLADVGTITGRAGGGGGDVESVRARGREGAPPGPHSELPTAEY